MLIEVILTAILLIICYKCFDFLLRLPGHRLWPTSRRCVLVTGCGSGFGQHFVQRCAARHSLVFAACRTKEAVKQIEELNDAVNIKAFVMDVTSEESVKLGFEFVRQNLPPEEGLWAVVNNAGIAARRIGPLDWTEVDDYKQVMEVNLFGMIRVTKAFLPLIKQTKGRFINVTSAAGRIALVRKGPYDTSKFAAEAFSDVLRQELSPFGVSVHIIEPGYYKTSMTEVTRISDVILHTWNSLPDYTKDEYGRNYVNAMLTGAEKRLQTASTKVDEVVDAYESAVFSWYPKTRYLVGAEIVLYGVLPHLPAFLSDFLLTRKIPTLIPAVMNKVMQKKQT